MANVVNALWLSALMQGDTNTALTGTVKVTLVDLADYTYSSAHEFISDVPAAARVATETLTGKTYTGGVLDATDTTLSSVTGDTSEALVVWIDTGVEGTSRLVAFIDTGVSGLPITPNGGDLNLIWNASGILRI